MMDLLSPHLDELERPHHNGCKTLKLFWKERAKYETVIRKKKLEGCKENKKGDWDRI